MKDKTILFRIDNKRFEKFQKECTKLNTTMSSILRACVDLFINLSPEREFQIMQDLADKNRYRRLLNENSLTNLSRELSKIGINLNQTTRSLNSIKKLSNISEPMLNEINEIIDKDNNLYKEIKIKIREANLLLKDIRDYYV